jgi:UDP-N-acetylmuramate--alanine ligase
MVGIGGIGMSGLAQLLVDKGNAVTGSDREASPVTDMLEAKGVSLRIGATAASVPADTDVLVYSAAVPEDNAERVRATELGIPQFSYFEMLGQIAEGYRTIAVAGTHGKTTTTGMLGKILIAAGASPTVIVGSLVEDFGGSNYVKGESDLLVVESCEYQRHFLNLNPEILVVTNLEFDHTDYYQDLADVQDAFHTLMEKVPGNGTIITDMENPNILPLLEGLDADVLNYTSEAAFPLKLPGDFNQMNARAAARAAKAVVPHLQDAQIISALISFTGTWRRFQYKGKTASGADLYDDYAHHPTAIKETLHALRMRVTEEKGENARIIVAFHPHLYSRTRDLLDGFTRAFTDADEVIIAPIYAAREIDDGTVSAEILAERINDEGGHARPTNSLEEVENILRTEAKEGDTIMTMGAGDIYKVADALVK